MQKTIYTKGNVIPWIVITIVILVIVFFVVRNNRMKENQNPISQEQTSATNFDTGVTNPPNPTSTSSVDQDMAAVDANLTIISSDSKDISEGINDTPIPQE